MGEKVKVLQKGRITIPADIRRRLAIKEGDYLTLEVTGNKVVIWPPNTVPNPTELLTGLTKGVKIRGSVKEELLKASAARIEAKLARSG